MYRIKNKLPEENRTCVIQRNGVPTHKGFRSGDYWFSIKGGNENITKIDKNDRWDYF